MCECSNRVSLGPIVRRKIDYHTDSPSRRVSAYLFVPAKRGRQSCRRFLCLHQTINIGKEEPAGLGTNVDLQYALHLAQRGYVTLAPDYPSFGEYAYDVRSEGGLRQRHDEGDLRQHARDRSAAIVAARSIRERIGCIGHSLGGHNTIFTAVFDPRIKAVVSNCGFTRFHKYYGGKLARAGRAPLHAAHRQPLRQRSRSGAVRFHGDRRLLCTAGLPGQLAAPRRAISRSPASAT